jgi:tRNA nucleotidyltransferase (CCA-adding enzyme)
VQLNASFFGELTDFFSARRDIKEKSIRVMHNLSFVEDPSRIFRAIRFEQRFNFNLSKLTKSLIENAVKMEFLNDLGGKRLFTELLILLKEDKVVSIINRLNDFNLLQFIHPSIEYNSNLKNIIKNINDVLSWYDLLYLENGYQRWQVYLLALLDPIKTDEIEKLIKAFDIKNKLANPIRIAKGPGNDVLFKLLKKRTIKNSEIYKLLKDIPVEVCLYAMAKTNRQITKKAYSTYFSKLQNIKIHVRGNDLKKLGISPGEIYKQIFDATLDVVLNEKVSGKEEEIKFIKKKFMV